MCVTVLPHRINISTLTLPHISPPLSSFDGPLFLSLHREPRLAPVEKYILFCILQNYEIFISAAARVSVCVRCNSIWPWEYSAAYSFLLVLIILSSSFSEYERKDRGSEMLLWNIHYSWVHIHNLESNEVRLIWLAVRDGVRDLIKLIFNNKWTEINQRHLQIQRYHLPSVCLFCSAQYIIKWYSTIHVYTVHLL